MIAKVLGIGDLMSGLMVLMATVFPAAWIIFFAKYLILKGGIFAAMGNIVSMIDVACGIYMIFLAFGHGFLVLNIIAIVFLMQKGLASLISF